LTDAAATRATLDIRDFRGRTVHAGRMDLGRSNGAFIEFPWAMTDGKNARVAPGLYFGSVELLREKEVIRTGTVGIRVAE
jgi:hypothetical protein